MDELKQMKCEACQRGAPTVTAEERRELHVQVPEWNFVEQDEIQRLEEYKEKLDRLLKEQQDLRDASAQSALSQRMAQQLDQAIQRVEALLEAQQELGDAAAKGASGSTFGAAT